MATVWPERQREYPSGTAGTAKLYALFRGENSLCTHLLDEYKAGNSGRTFPRLKRPRNVASPVKSSRQKFQGHECRLAQGATRASAGAPRL